MIYLLAFLYSKQKEKVIVFVSNCEMANFICNVLAKFDWNKCGRRIEERPQKDVKKDDKKEEEEEKAQILFDGTICKLHGDMEHE